MPEFKAVIFDMDGVLADTASIYFPLMKKYLHAHSIKISDEDIANLVGYNFAAKTKFINEKYNVKINHLEFVESVSVKARDFFESDLKAEENAVELVHELRKKKLKIALATSNGEKNTEVILKAINLNNAFDVIVTGTHTSNAKPHPEVYLKALELLELKAENCIVIEDTVIGIESAKGAGLKVIACPNKFNPHHDFSRANLKVSSLSELNYSVLKELVEK